MGNAGSKSASEPGPPLTLRKKSLSGDPGLNLWLKELLDRTNESRKAIIAVLCPAVLAASLDTSCENLSLELLRICNSSAERRKNMLQWPFLDGQTPLAWTICNLPDSVLLPHDLNRLPRIVATLLDCCGDRSTPGLMDMIFAACCIRDSNSLFQLLNPYSKTEGSQTPVYSIKTTSRDELAFAIHDFPTRMLSDGRIDMRFIHQSRLYSIGFCSGKGGEWNFFYRLVLDHGAVFEWCREIHIDLHTQYDFLDGEGEPPKRSRFASPVMPVRDVLIAKLAGNPYCDTTEGQISAGMLKTANPYVGAARKLIGCIRLSK